MSDIRRQFCNPVIAGWIAFFAVIAVLLTHYSTKYGLNVAPSRSGDELSYDIIGWNLSQGLGFAEGGYSPKFRAIYEGSSNGSATFPGADCEAIAYRPPLFPLILSILNKTIGRQFWAVRVWNAMAMAATAGLLVWYLVKTSRGSASLVAFMLLLIADTRTRLYGRAILTEATATMLMSVATLLLIAWFRTRDRRLPGLLGIVLGMATLSRSMFVIWIPCVALVLLLYPSLSSTAGRRRFYWQPATYFVAFALLLLFPWAIRNTNALGRFMPLGTQGMMQLHAGFSDHAVEHRGVWTLDAELEIRRELDLTGLSQLQTEVAVATHSRHRATQWIAAHPGTSIQLGFLKIWQEYRPRSATAWLIAVCAVIGAAGTIRRTDTEVCLLLHAINSLTIAATWSVEGRFVVPLLFSIHLLAAQGAALPLRLLRSRNSTDNTDAQIRLDRTNV